MSEQANLGASLVGYGGKFFTGERLQMFSDAVFSIFATIMAIPLRLSRDEADKHGEEENFLRHFLLNQWSAYLVYIFSFLVIVDLWYSHCRLFLLMDRVDQKILNLNMLLLLTISFLPYSIGLISKFHGTELQLNYDLVLLIASLNLFIVMVVLIVFLSYIVLRRRTVVHKEARKDPHYKLIVFGLYCSIGVSAVCALLGMILFTHPTASFFFYVLILFSSLTTKTVFHCIISKLRKTDDDVEETVLERTERIFKQVANKERTEAFSDGVYAIVATIILLDLTVQDLPTPEEVQKNFNNSIAVALAEKSSVFISYTISFFVVGILYSNQYGMFHYIKEFTSSLSIINTLNLLLVCTVPFLSSLLAAFAYTNLENEITALRVTTVLLFFMGLFQMIFWVVAVCQKKEALTDEIDKKWAGNVMFLKTSVFPFLCFIAFWTTFANNFSSYSVFICFIYGAPFVNVTINLALSLLECVNKMVLKMGKSGEQYPLNQSPPKEALYEEGTGTMETPHTINE